MAYLTDALFIVSGQAADKVDANACKLYTEQNTNARNEIFKSACSTTAMSKARDRDTEIVLMSPDTSIALTLSDEYNDAKLAELIEQSGGGVVDFIKSLFRLRSFDKYISRYEAAKTKIEKKMVSYEAETARLKNLADEWAANLKKLFLNEKYRVMWTLERDKTYAQQAYKRSVMDQQIKRIKLEKERIEKNIKLLAKSVKKKLNLSFSFLGFDFIFDKKDVKFGNIYILNNYIGKFKERVERDQELFIKLAEDYNDFTEEIAKANELKSVYAVLAGKDQKELTSVHRDEIKMYEKNKERYEKMLSFSESRRDELLSLIQRKEKLYQDIDSYRNIFENGGFDKQYVDITNVLNNKWSPAMKSLFDDLTDSIKQAGTWKGELETIKTTFSENGNQISKLTAGMSEFSIIKKEYELQLENTSKVIEIQTMIESSLKDIKNNFIKLVPDINLLPDMFHVTSAQGFVVEMINAIKHRQKLMGTDVATGTDYIKQKLQHAGGGVPASTFLNLTFNDKGYIEGDGLRGNGGRRQRQSGMKALDQAGGIFLANQPNYNYTLTPNNSFLFDSDGYIYDVDERDYVTSSTAVSASGSGVVLADDIQPLFCPYGTRPLDDPGSVRYNDLVNNYLTDYIDNNDLYYIPVYNIADDTVTILSCMIDTVKLMPEIVGTFQLPNYTPFQTTKIADYLPPNTIDDNFYIYVPFTAANFNNGSRPEGKVRTTCSLLGNSDLFVLPLLYYVNRVEKIIGQFEYIIINPFNGFPLSSTMCWDNAIPANSDFNQTTNKMNIRLHVVDEVDFVDDVVLDYLNRISASSFATYYNYCGNDIVFFDNSDPVHLPDDTANPGNILTYTYQDNAGTNHDMFGEVTLADLSDPTAPGHTDAYLAEKELMFKLTQYLNHFMNRCCELEIDNKHNLINITGTVSTINKPKLADIPALIHRDDPVGSNDKINLTFNENIFSLPQLSEMYNIDMNDQSSLNILTLEISRIQSITKDIVSLLRYNYQLDKKQQQLAGANLGGLPIPQISVSISGGGSVAGGLTLPNPNAPGGYQSILPTPAPNPKAAKAVDYLKRILTGTSPYWDNLKNLQTSLNKFFSPEYLAYEQLIMRILDQMMEVRKFEDKILKIDVAKDKDILPTYSYIYKNLEVKVDPTGKEGFGDNAKKLYEKLKESKDYMKFNKATLGVNPDNIIYDMQTEMYKMLEYSNITQYKTSFFQTPAGIPYKEYLSTIEGASEFFKVITTHPYFGDRYKKAKIAHALMIALVTYGGSDPALYNFYAQEARESMDKLASAATRKPGQQQAKPGQQQAKPGQQQAKPGQQGQQQQGTGAPAQQQQAAQPAATGGI